MKGLWRPAAVLLALTVIVVAASAGGAGARPGSVSGALTSYPRNQTLITSGSQWGNITGTNPYVGGAATGTVGLLYETLLRYDPVKDVYVNWLASSAKFTGPNVYTIVVRPNVKWTDGKAFTASDVAFNLNLLRFNTS